jgi:hypothetical protein
MPRCAGRSGRAQCRLRRPSCLHQHPVLLACSLVATLVVTIVPFNPTNQAEAARLLDSLKGVLRGSHHELVGMSAEQYKVRRGRERHTHSRTQSFLSFRNSRAPPQGQVRCCGVRPHGGCVWRFAVRRCVLLTHLHPSDDLGVET